MTSLSEHTHSWRALRERAVFRITGPDRVRYLNGQVTNDVSGKLEDHAIAACLCTIKGKVEALVWISSDGDSLFLDGELIQREVIHARLERYLIADDCEITDVTDDIILVHHFFPEEPGVPSKRTQATGRDLFLSNREVISFGASAEITDEQWALQQTIAEIPRSGDEITGAEFPAELGLDSFAVSFHKGCYLGQEIISRIESIGRVKRRLSQVKTEKSLEKGSRITNAHGEIGETTRPSIPRSQNKWISLAFFPVTQNKALSTDGQPLTGKQGNDGQIL
ncbi:MAG: folate-binding protein YgfZ [Verrucomicrobiales bacterium]|jgi:folate-binding protein YgfZ|nr:folate-binding protein YgfZ [Verrucomicrobiales bacterium]